ncbi:MAG: hypothetical protein ACJAU5_001274 [Maricaulis maris]|jgi:hypothetical protein|uniref:Uncharacterized protein n=1 Tax=Maricaulis maris (strain MCS10) TaxID=394221 RepID=Q0AMX0_MARMM|nr:MULTISPECIES: hypothetical protein [Maricaulis]ABI66367.1 hypothetical protein Mmar10_2075 [Maricaulis maris MCS10]MAC90412.1 hypothetical protein [Maricaulis sp.]
MTDPVAAAIEPIREKFVQAYTQWLPEMQKHFPQGVSEHPFAIQHDKSLIRNLYRIDFATQIQPKPEFREFRLQDMLAFKSWDGPVEGVHLHLHPFRWDALVVQLQGAKWDEAAVTRWFDRWFGMMKDTPVVTPGVQTGGFIHAASLQDEMLHVDLGTAPVEALTELLAIARTTGASAIALVDPVVRPTTPSGEALN